MNPEAKALSVLLANLGSCVEAREWAQTQPDLATAWTECDRGDWMVWCLRRLKYGDTRGYQAIASGFAKLCWEQRRDPRSRRAVDVVEAYLRAKATVDALREERDAAYVFYADAVAAAYAAAYAAADFAAAVAVRKAEADIVRRYVPDITAVYAVFVAEVPT